ncbi:Epimerase family protein [Legionella massiliensis]|uniref:Epimerase family protein n=1 Tax=Legionella massiliensis TaxID=1034943 RepID=A0A078KZ62_9GAMM|nr:TIGR01777 family oxidoreductase [Legionella massiliensis]CDZ77003.1 Epimerase family protein [Legionella massiliensis]CEE12741.1 Epimerase family protein [Legionella massiliensis]
MKILIAGASGLIGHHLVQALRTNHDITVLGRDAALLEKTFPQGSKICTWDSLENLDAKTYDAVINLCGHNIGASRWNSKIKTELIKSRVKTSTKLIDWASKQGAKPHFYCANAIGIYGMQQNGDPQAFDEDSPINFANPPDFLSEIGVRWQQAMQPAIDQGMPVTITRFGVALKKGEGMLKKLSPSFYFGLGAVIGDGKQILSWVHIEDIVAAYSFLLANPKLEGAFNLCAPLPVSQAQFAHSLAKAMHRPLFMKMPAFVVSKLFGEMGECLLLKGQRVVPKRLVDAGFQFRYPDIASALEHEYHVGLPPGPSS